MLIGHHEKQAARHTFQLLKEIQRAETHLALISETLNDPRIDLAPTMDLDIRRKELEGYLKGLRYALGENEEFTVSTQQLD